MSSLIEQTLSVRRDKLVFTDKRSQQQDFLTFSILQKCLTAQYPDILSVGLLLYALDHHGAGSRACACANANMLSLYLIMLVFPDVH